MRSRCISRTTIDATDRRKNAAIAWLKENSAGGPDGIPPIFLKIVRSQLATPLAFLYQLFFDSSFVPPIWLQFSKKVTRPLLVTIVLFL